MKKLYVIILFLVSIAHAELGRTGGRLGDDWRGIPPLHSSPVTSPGRSDDPFSRRMWDEHTRIYTSTASLIQTKTFTPISLAVYTKFGSAVASFDHQIIHQTDTYFDLIAVGLPDNQEMWDSQGRATLAETSLVCRISHKGTISDAQKAGLSLGIIGAGLPGVATVDMTSGVQIEFRESSSEEEIKRCPVGTIPKYTKEEEIKKLCSECTTKVLPTLKRDIEARMKNYAFLVKNPVCQRDDDCPIKAFPWDYWHVGRCVLTKDANKNYISECQIRSRIGGACPGKGSSHMFEYYCDKGLECKFIREGDHWWTFGPYDYDKYECRDPKRPHLTKPDQR